MGDIEIKDQITAVLSYGTLIDQTRVGIFGWSYGGYMSAMSLCRAPGFFKCAVAGAPVTFWEGYDTHYTGRCVVINYIFLCMYGVLICCCFIQVDSLLCFFSIYNYPTYQT